jgi:branched-chain amino acid transport system permease protein
MEFFAIQLLNGLVYGTLVFLTAVGLSLIFGLLNVMNLAHGSFFMLGAFAGLAISKITHSFWWALILAPIPVIVLGMIVEMLFLRPLYKRDHKDQVLLTFGFTFVFFDLVQSIWGRTIQSLPGPALLSGVVVIGDDVFSAYRLFLIGLGGAITVLLWLFFEWSRLGAMVRAGVDNATMAASLGGNVPLLFSSVFGAGVGLAAVGGVVAGPVLGLYPGMDNDILVPAFIVTVIGGMGSLRGAFAGSLLIGVVDTFGKAYFPNTAMFLVYLLMAAVLLIRPRGLFGITRQASGAAAQTASAKNGSSRRPSHIWGALLLIVLIVFPFLTPPYPAELAAEIFVFAIFAMSLDLLVGYTGMMSLGHAAFFGIGAYVMAYAESSYGLNGWFALFLGVAAAALGAAAIGVLCVRMSGVPFVMLTFAFAQLIFAVALKWRDVTGGSDGLAIAGKPAFFGLDLSHPRPMYFLALIVFVASYLVLRRLIRSPLGHVFIGIRENETRMQAIGYPTTSYKLLCFTISGAFAGLAGGLYVIFNSFISPDSLYWSASGNVLIMTMLGGAGTLIGPVLGAGLFLLMENLVSSYSDHWMLIIGVIFIASVLFFPEGLWGLVERLRLRASRP